MALDDFFTLSELKDGFTNTTRVKELVSMIQCNKLSPGDDAFRQRTTVAITIAATKNRECLGDFVNSGGLRYLNLWLIDTQKYIDGNTEKSIEELILALLKALANLCVLDNVSLTILASSAVKKLAANSNFQIQGHARKLLSALKSSNERSNKEKRQLLDDLLLESKTEQDKCSELQNKNVSETQCESLLNQNFENSSDANVREREVKSGDLTAHCENEGEKDDTDHSDKTLREPRRSHRLMIKSESLRETGKISADIELGTQSSSEKLSDESGESQYGGLQRDSPSKGVSVGDNIMDEKKSKPKNEKIPLDFDLNQEYCADETDATTNTGSTSTLKPESDTVKGSSNAPLFAEDSSGLPSGQGRKRKAESEDITGHGDNEEEKDDTDHSDKKMRTNSMTISQNLGEIDKPSTDIELATLDAVEVSIKSAKEMDSKELSQSSSEKLSDESRQSRDDSLNTSSPASKGLSVGESHSFEEPHVRDDITDEIKNIDDVQESDLASSPKSDTVLTSGIPTTTPLQLVSRENQKIVNDFDLNVAEVGNDQVEDKAEFQLPISSPNTIGGGESSFEANTHGSNKFNFDLNLKYTNEDKNKDNHQQSSSSVSSPPITQQISKELNIDLNEKPESPESVFIFGTKMALNKKYPVSKQASDMANTENSLDLAPITQQSGNEVSFDMNVKPESPKEQSILLFGEKITVGRRLLASDSTLYGHGTEIPYMAESQDGMGWILNQQIQEQSSTRLASELHNMKRLWELNFDQISESNAEEANRVPVVFREYLSPGPTPRGDKEESSSKRKEPETPLEFPPHKR